MHNIDLTNSPREAFNLIFSDIYNNILLLFNDINATNEQLNKMTDNIASFKLDIIETLRYQEDVTESFFIQKSINQNILTDRDGSAIPSIAYNINLNDSYIALNLNDEEDLLRDNDGNILARILIQDYVGQRDNRLDDLKFAIDGDLNSFLDLTTTQDNIIDSTINGFDGLGAYSLLNILLNKYRDVTELEILPLSSTPIDIVAIYVNGKNILDEELNEVFERVIINIPAKYNVEEKKIYPTIINSIQILLRQSNYIEINDNRPEFEKHIEDLKDRFNDEINEYANVIINKDVTL